MFDLNYVKIFVTKYTNTCYVSKKIQDFRVIYMVYLNIYLPIIHIISASSIILLFF